MNAPSSVQPAAGHGIIDAAGRLIEADGQLRQLHAQAGGEEGGFLAVPQIAAVARLARRLQASIAQTALAADGNRNVKILVRAEPAGGNIRLSLDPWVEVADRPLSRTFDRRADLERASVDWTWQADSELRFTRLSPLAAGMAGSGLTNLRGKPLTALFRLRECEDGSLPILTALAGRTGFDRQHAEIRSGDGECVILSAHPLIGPSGEFLGLSGSATRVSEGDLAEEDRGTAAIAPAFGERLDEALRAPLAQIIEEAEALARQQAGPMAPSYAGYAADINSAARHLLSLVDDLSVLQSSGRANLISNLTTIDLAPAAREAVLLLRRQAEEKGVTLVLPPEGNSPAIGDYRKVVQVIVNLVTNAIRYSPEHAEVLVELGGGNGKAWVSVTDQGKGIHPSDQKRIFEKFERLDPTEPGGTGLGLFTSRELARAMGGDIQIESGWGKGSRFSLSLTAR